MPKNNTILELKKSLNEILTDLQRKKMAFRGMHPPQSINEGINALETLQSIPIDSLEHDEVQCDDVPFVKQLINIERLFINSFRLKMYPLPNLTEIINPAALVYAEMDLQLDALENSAKNLLDRGHSLASSKAINMVSSLRKLNRAYFIKGKIDYLTYEKKSLAIIGNEEPELKKYSGYTEIFGILVILIASLGKKQLINEVRTEHFLFFKQPGDDTQQIEGIDGLDETISSAPLKKKEPWDLSL